MILLSCKTWATFCHCFVHQHDRLITLVKTEIFLVEMTFGLKGAVSRHLSGTPVGWKYFVKPLESKVKFPVQKFCKYNEFHFRRL